METNNTQPAAKKQITETKITSVRHETERRAWGRFTVFTRSATADKADEFFNKHEIYKLKFKCRTWGKITRTTAAMDIAQIAPKIAEHFKTEVGNFELKYSRTAGCSCGCSPGFIGKTKQYVPELSGHNVCMDVALAESDAKILDATLVLQEVALQKEIAAHTAEAFAAAPLPTTFE